MSTCGRSEWYESGGEERKGKSEDLLDDWLESEVNGFRRWHIILLSLAAFVAFVVCVCCCHRFRIPRTKQEIQADYIRKKLTRKFQRQLKLLHNSEMNEMDLKRALDRIRGEFISDTESLAKSDTKLLQQELDLDKYLEGDHHQLTRRQGQHRSPTERISAFTFMRKNSTPISATV